MKRVRAVGIVIQNTQVLLMHRISRGKEYYVFPGGSVEPGETVEEAVIRELYEETSLTIQIEKLLYHHVYDNDTEQFFYLCSSEGNTPKLGEGNEKKEMEKGVDFFNPMWFEIENIKNLLLYPLEIRDWLIEDILNNFIHTPRVATISLSNLREKN